MKTLEYEYSNTIKTFKLLRFTFHYHVSQKISLIQKLNLLLKALPNHNTLLMPHHSMVPEYASMILQSFAWKSRKPSCGVGY